MNKTSQGIKGIPCVRPCHVAVHTYVQCLNNVSIREEKKQEGDKAEYVYAVLGLFAY